MPYTISLNILSLDIVISDFMLHGNNISYPVVYYYKNIIKHSFILIEVLYNYGYYFLS